MSSPAGTFGPTNAPATCLYCGAKLRPARYAEKGSPPLGAYGDGSFCTLRCAASFGRGAARLGFRFKPLSAEQLKQRAEEARKARAKLRAAAAERASRHCAACQHTGPKYGCYCAAWGCVCAFSKARAGAA